MRAKFVYESIKHLTPKSNEEIYKAFWEMNASDQVQSIQNNEIVLSDEDTKKLYNSLTGLQKLSYHSILRIPIPQDERKKLFLSSMNNPQVLLSIAYRFDITFNDDDIRSIYDRLNHKQQVQNYQKYYNILTSKQKNKVRSKLSPQEKLIYENDFNLKLSNDEKKYLLRQVPDFERKETYVSIKIKLTNDEILDLLNLDTSRKIATFGLEYSKPDVYELALKLGHKITSTDQKVIMRNQRYFREDDDESKYSDWRNIIKKHISIKEKITDRPDKQNKKDYDKARKNIIEKTKGKLIDITSLKQEKRGTMAFKKSKTGDEIFSITKSGYVRRSWGGGYSRNSAPWTENPYATYVELADFFVNYLFKNKYDK